MSGIITGPYFRNFFNFPSALELGTMVAVLEVGAFSAWVLFRLSLTHLMVVVTSIVAGRVGDGIGRKGTLFIGALIFTVGGVVQTFTLGFWSMVIGRVVSGFGVGLLSYVGYILISVLRQLSCRTIVPIYQSEISPPSHVCPLE